MFTKEISSLENAKDGEDTSWSSKVYVVDNAETLPMTMMRKVIQAAR